MQVFTDWKEYEARKAEWIARRRLECETFNQRESEKVEMSRKKAALVTAIGLPIVFALVIASMLAR